jgi:hypothetical protein
MASPDTSAHRKEWQALLECACPASNTLKRNELLAQADFLELLKLADDHGVTGLLAARLASAGGGAAAQETLQELQGIRRSQLLISLGMTAELLGLIEKLNGAGMEALAIKGPTLSVRAYGDAGMRQFGDLDFLVRDRDILRATELMIEMGYQEEVPLTAIRAGKIPGEYVFKREKNKLRVELHTEYTLRYFPRTVDVEGLFQRKIDVRIDSHDVPALSLEDEIVMLCVHGAKDLWERLLWIADVAGLLGRQTSLDWKRAAELARQVGATRMLHTGLQLSRKLLGATLPPEIEARVGRDVVAGKLAEQIARWVPAAGYEPPSLMERAMLRMRLRGGVISGALYLLRLSFSPTEDDWMGKEAGKRNGLIDGVLRPLRLARKYGQDGKK